jgi:hypothetical protein
MIDLLIDILAVVSIGSGLIALIVGFCYVREMHRDMENDQ